MRSRQYGEDVLAPPSRRPAPPPRIAAESGLVVEDGAGDFCGAVVSCEKDAVTLEDRHGRRRVFPLTGTFLLEGKRVTLVRPARRRRRRRRPDRRTASGSIAAPVSRAKVARASRIYVEGKHDAELVEKVWGDDLRDVGVVVEFLNGIDDLPAIVADFAPDARPAPRRACRSPGGRLQGEPDRGSGQLAARPRSSATRIIDVWAAVKPSVLGIDCWPDVPRGTPWKEGVLAAIGWPADPAAGWRRILGAVRSYADLEPAFLGRVEELIDFVTAPGSR